MPTKTHRVQNYYHMYTSRGGGGGHFKANVYCLWTHFYALEHRELRELVITVTVTCRMRSAAFDLLYVNTNVAERQAAFIIRV
jgi:hypothetical protein